MASIPFISNTSGIVGMRRRLGIRGRERSKTFDFGNFCAVVQEV
jgi:hypothetical protein